MCICTHAGVNVPISIRSRKLMIKVSLPLLLLLTPT